MYAFCWLTLLVAGCPSGSGFLVNGQKVDVRRDYSVASTRHTGVDNATEGELEHDITRSQAQLGPFHDLYRSQTGLC
jgi:hypothetical protein